MDKKSNALISEIEGIIGKEPTFFLKFTSKREYAEDIINGKFYANTAEYFRNLEIKSGEHGQGDKNELLQVMKTSNIRLFDYDTKKLSFTIPIADTSLKYNDDDNIPLVCFVGIPVRQMKLFKQSKSEVVFKFPFTEEEYKTIEKKFGAYCVLIEAKILLEKIQEYSIKNEIAYAFKCVNYCASNYCDKIRSFITPTIDRFFYKDEDLSYQREYRLILNTKIPEDHYIDLGVFGDKARIIESSEIEKLALGCTFK